MNHGILKRVIALCIAGGVMALALAACGDSEENNEGTGTVQDVSQDVTREDEDGTVGVNESGDAVNADSSGNDVRVAHASSSGNSGNGFAVPVFKPGEEPDPGQELQPGEEPQPGADSKPDTGTQSSTGTQKPQQPQSNTGASSGAGTQTAHTHNFQGGNCITQATCSCGATGNYGGHNWTTKTVHHDATGHYESRVTGGQTVVVGYTPEEQWWKCTCGWMFESESEFEDHIPWWSKVDDKRIHSFGEIVIRGNNPIYDWQEIVENEWVQDTAAWDEKVTTCSICGATQ